MFSTVAGRQLFLKLSLLNMKNRTLVNGTHRFEGEHPIVSEESFA